jgi:hypothetical protein
LHSSSEVSSSIDAAQVGSPLLLTADRCADRQASYQAQAASLINGLGVPEMFQTVTHEKNLALGLPFMVIELKHDLLISSCRRLAYPAFLGPKSPPSHKSSSYV